MRGAYSSRSAGGRNCYDNKSSSSSSSSRSNDNCRRRRPGASNRTAPGRSLPPYRRHRPRGYIGSSHRPHCPRRPGIAASSVRRRRAAIARRRALPPRSPTPPIGVTIPSGMNSPSRRNASMRCPHPSLGVLSCRPTSPSSSRTRSTAPRLLRRAATRRRTATMAAASASAPSCTASSTDGVGARGASRYSRCSLSSPRS